jgi:hypothetical protein
LRPYSAYLLLTTQTRALWLFRRTTPDKCARRTARIKKAKAAQAVQAGESALVVTICRSFPPIQRNSGHEPHWGHLCATCPWWKFEVRKRFSKIPIFPSAFRLCSGFPLWYLLLLTDSLKIRLKQTTSATQHLPGHTDGEDSQHPRERRAQLDALHRTSPATRFNLIYHLPFTHFMPLWDKSVAASVRAHSPRFTLRP